MAVSLGWVCHVDRPRVGNPPVAIAWGSSDPVSCRVVLVWTLCCHSRDPDSLSCMPVLIALGQKLFSAPNSIPETYMPSNKIGVCGACRRLTTPVFLPACIVQSGNFPSWLILQYRVLWCFQSDCTTFLTCVGPNHASGYTTSMVSVLSCTSRAQVSVNTLGNKLSTRSIIPCSQALRSSKAT